MLNIKEVEKLTNITKQNIRYYERQGLIFPKRNPENDYREYSEQDIRQLKIIKILRKLDMPIEEIRRLLHHDIILSDAMELQKERLEKERNRLEDALEFCSQINEKELEQLDVDDCLLKMKNAEERGAVFANLLNDYKKVVQLEEMREFRFMPDSMCMNPSEFTEELCKFANKKHLNLVITKEGMYPEFAIDGIEYEAEREFSRYGAVIHCHMKYFDEIVPLEMPKKKYKQMSMFHKLLPLAIVAIVLVLLVIIRFEDVGNWADKSVIIIGALVEIFVFHRYYYNMEE